jgi:hypothetical protein
MLTDRDIVSKGHTRKKKKRMGVTCLLWRRRFVAEDIASIQESGRGDEYSAVARKRLPRSLETLNADKCPRPYAQADYNPGMSNS